MSAAFKVWLEQQAQVRLKRGLVRQLHTRTSDSAVLDLAGNDYLGLATDARVVEAATKALSTWGTGATASRLVTGTTRLHTDLEDSLAEFTGQPAALLFSSGYLANMGLVTSLGGPGTLLLTDAHIHASLVDASRLSRAHSVIYEHNSVDQVAVLLATRTEPRAIVVTESVFSVLGDEAPLLELAAVCARYDALLVVDEAHGIGVTGSGRGSVAHHGLAGAEHVIVTATLSKALASQGGVVLGSAALRDHLINRARSFIFDTALAPASVAAAYAALEVIRSEPERVAAIHRNAALIAQLINEGTHLQQDVPRNGPLLPRTVNSGVGAVQSIPIGNPETAVSFADRLLAEGIRVGCFRPPSVPDGISRLRLTARATLTEQDIGLACAAISAALNAASTALKELP